MNQKTRILSLLFVLATLAAVAQKPEVFSTKEGAIQGYDPVAFFKESKPVIGKKELTYLYKDATWHFSTQENLNAFTSDPERFAPQYGGYCAYGTASGHKSPTQPETWTIVDHKLYFNYNKDVQKLWNKDQRSLIEKATKNWPTVKKQ